MMRVLGWIGGFVAAALVSFAAAIAIRWAAYFWRVFKGR